MRKAENCLASGSLIREILEDAGLLTLHIPSQQGKVALFSYRSARRVELYMLETQMKALVYLATAR
jgi:hypothetical protein